MSSGECPICKAGLAVKYFGKIELQHCLSCGGFWVQRNRLGDILQKYMGFIAERRDKECGMRQRANPYELEAALLECPNCRHLMKKLNYAYNSNVIVDVCRPCCGIWLDRGEIEKIAHFMKSRGLPEGLKQEFARIKTLYDHHDRQEALDILRDLIVWILSFLL